MSPEEKHATSARQERRDREQLAWSEGVRRQEEFIVSGNWSEHQAHAIREWIAKEHIDLATFSLEVDYVPIFSYHSKGYGRNEDDTEADYEGFAYDIAARGRRPENGSTELKRSITLKEFFESESFYKQHENDLPFGKLGAFKYFIRKKTVIAARDAIATNLSDVYHGKEARINENRAQALIAEKAQNELSSALEKATAVRERARGYGIDLAPVQDFGIGEAKQESLDTIAGATRSAEEYIVSAQHQIEAELKKRGEREFMSEDALRRALEMEPVSARWYVRDVDPSTIEAYGRKLGEGFGEKVAGKPLYLAGDKGVVGIGFFRLTSRYKKEIRSFGVSPLGGTREGRLPDSVGKRDIELLALIEDPNWNVQWISYHDGNPYMYTLANAKGIGSLSRYEDGQELYESEDWEGIGGQGPTPEVIRVIFNLEAMGKDEQHAVKKMESPLSDMQSDVREHVPQVTFTPTGKRYFQCNTCDAKERLTSSDFARYEQGEEIEMICPGCQGHGTVHKH